MEISHNSEVLLDVVKSQEGPSSHSFNHFEGNSPVHQSSRPTTSPYIKMRSYRYEKNNWLVVVAHSKREI